MNTSTNEKCYDFVNFRRLNLMFKVQQHGKEESYISFLRGRRKRERLNLQIHCRFSHEKSFLTFLHLFEKEKVPSLFHPLRRTSYNIKTSYNNSSKEVVLYFKLWEKLRFIIFTQFFFFFFLTKLWHFQYLEYLNVRATVYDEKHNWTNNDGKLLTNDYKPRNKRSCNNSVDQILKRKDSIWTVLSLFFSNDIPASCSEWKNENV